MLPCDPNDVRARILSEATRLFGRKGYSATSVREVVAAAGVTKPTLYYYFANKEALFSEAIGAQLDGLRMLIEHALTTPGPAPERLRDFIDVYVRGGIDNPESVRLMMTATAPTDTSQPKVLATERFWAELQRLAGLFEQGVDQGLFRADLDIETAIMMLVGAADVALMVGLSGLPVPDEFADRILATLLEGCRP